MERLPKIRLFVPTDYAAETEIALSPEQAHYVGGVMRRSVGEIVGVFNGTDGEWAGEITEIGRKRAQVRLLRQARPHRPPPDLWLLFAPLKKARIDYMSQKATEMGAAVLQPVLTERTVAERVKTARLRANAIEAAEQCTMTAVPAVHEPVSLTQALAGLPAERRLMFCDEAGGTPALQALLGFEKGQPWAILIGPEGGFAPAEAAAVRALPQAVPVSLGPRIMRADTAAVAALAIWQACLGDWAAGLDSAG